MNLTFEERRLLPLLHQVITFEENRRPILRKTAAPTVDFNALHAPITLPRKTKRPNLTSPAKVQTPASPQHTPKTRNTEIFDFKKVGLERLLEALCESIQDLTPREVDILKRRHSLTGQVWTLAELSHEYQIARERVRQIEQNALRKLRKAIILRIENEG